ncbi:MAG: ferritin-like domain-containing protein [Rhodothermales bacterium]
MDRSTSYRLPLSSQVWVNHFRENLKETRINWRLPAILDTTWDKKLIRSLQAWQRGETSDGAHLLRAARAYAERVDDPDYVTAITLFIQEEQKHGENLGKYLDAIGAPRLVFDLGDWLFRRVRYFNTSMELWTITVITVELFAQFYYAALARASHCPLLTQVCRDILLDESHHIRFQAERLQTLLKDRRSTLRRLSKWGYRGLFYGVALSVWVGHGVVFRKGGWSFARYWSTSSRRFSRLMSGLDAAPDGLPARAAQRDSPVRARARTVLPSLE